ncbi:hypothetical protein KSA69_14135 [Acinetobacter baumannii]|nr:hypothetical protein [Acinetobacter baumannii]MCE6797878.1 hypothetical protein [Acinetobacter baumannii]
MGMKFIYATKPIGIIRACTNLIGNCVATVVIAHWEKDIDHAQAKQVLNIKN